jgi:predicted ester cyclase
VTIRRADRWSDSPPPKCSQHWRLEAGRADGAGPAVPGTGSRPANQPRPDPSDCHLTRSHSSCRGSRMRHRECVRLRPGLAGHELSRWANGNIYCRADRAVLWRAVEQVKRCRGSLGRETLGRQGWRQYRDLVRAGSADFRNEIVELVSEGERAAARLRYTGSIPGYCWGCPRRSGVSNTRVRLSLLQIIDGSPVPGSSAISTGCVPGSADIALAAPGGRCRAYPGAVVLVWR